MGNKNFFSAGENIRTASVIGCGWLGLPLAQALIKSGWDVKGTTTRLEKMGLLEAAGIKAYLLKLPAEKMGESPLFQSGTYIINIPTGRRDQQSMKDYPTSIETILTHINHQKARNIIFVSSTSVYPDNADIIDEESQEQPSTESGKAILDAERIVKHSGIPWTILRLGGLAGPNRHPGRFLSGKSRIRGGDQVINFVHRDDAIEIIKYFAEHPTHGEIFNVTAPIHPLKRDFYTVMSKAIGAPAPEFDVEHHSQRREISGKKLLAVTNYQFSNPDPLKFSY